MRKYWVCIALIGLLCGCGSSSQDFHQISAEEAKTMMEAETVVVLDVRTEAEFADGHIPNAINIPLDQLETSTLLPSEKTQTILVYCRSGNRSKTASAQLSKMEYINVYDFGGLQDWPFDIVK